VRNIFDKFRTFRLKIEAVYSFKMPTTTHQTLRRPNSEDCNLIYTAEADISYSEVDEVNAPSIKVKCKFILVFNELSTGKWR
jgi:hypothetical protein